MRHSPFATSSETADLLRAGAEVELPQRRACAVDMILIDDAAHLVGASTRQVEAWIRVGRCIGLVAQGGEFRLPRWQFEAGIWPLLRDLAGSLGTADGWAMLAFLETPHPALDGRSPRSVLEQGLVEEGKGCLGAAQLQRSSAEWRPRGARACRRGERVVLALAAAAAH